MPSRTIGLDIGTHAVRAVELNFSRGQATMQRMGQVALPYGSVVAGEVVDAPAVAAALRRLWREVGFRQRSVVVGVANQRVVARVIDVPAMPEEDLRSALQFQVQDLIPIPLAEAVLDHQIVERFTGDDSQEQYRVLVVAAHRDMLQSLLAALEGAGLSASRIDLEPFALVRSLYAPPFHLDEEAVEAVEAGAEAIVDVGAGVTNVVVHEQGMPRFVRTLPTGGNALSEAVATDLSVELDDAEELKRRADPVSAEADSARAAAVISSSLTPVVNEVRGSLDFWLAQSAGSRLARVLLTGGGSRHDELATRLHTLLGVPVEPGRPLRAVALGNTGLAPEVLERNEDLLAVPLGLALSGESLEGSARRITLLPSEVTVRRAERRQMAMAGAGVACLAALLVGLFLLRNGQVGRAGDEAEQEEARTEALEQRAASLQSLEGLESDIAARQQTVTTVLEGDVAWTRLLQEIATVIPGDVWLTSFTGTAATAPGPTGEPGTPGTVSVSGMGFDQTSAARWLLRVGELDSLTNLWLPSSTRQEGGAQTLITFSSDAQLTSAAGSDRLARFMDGPT